MGIYDIIHYLGIICGYQYDMTGLYICECFVKLSSNTSYDDSMVKPNEKKYTYTQHYSCGLRVLVIMKRRRTNVISVVMMIQTATIIINNLQRAMME